MTLAALLALVAVTTTASQPDSFAHLGSGADPAAADAGPVGQSWLLDGQPVTTQPLTSEIVAALRPDVRATSDTAALLASSAGSGAELSAELAPEEAEGPQFLARWDQPSGMWLPSPTFIVGNRAVARGPAAGTWALLVASRPLVAVGPEPRTDVGGGTGMLALARFVAIDPGCAVELPDRIRPYRLEVPSDGAVRWCLEGDADHEADAVLRITSQRSYAMTLTTRGLGLMAAAPTFESSPPLPTAVEDDLSDPTVFGLPAPPAGADVRHDYLLLPGETVAINVSEQEVLGWATDAPPSVTIQVTPETVAAGAAWLAAQYTSVGAQALVTRFAAKYSTNCTADPAPAAMIGAEPVCWAGPAALLAWSALATPQALRHYGAGHLSGDVLPPSLTGELWPAALTAAALQWRVDGTGTGTVDLRAQRLPTTAPTPTPCAVPDMLRAWTHVDVGDGKTLWAYQAHHAPLVVLRNGDTVLDCRFLGDGDGADVGDLVCSQDTEPTQCLMSAYVGMHSLVTTFIEVFPGAVAVKSSGHESPLPQVFYLDLDGDGDLDIVNAVRVYDEVRTSPANENYAWATYRQGPVGVFSLTGCSPKLTPSADWVAPSSLLTDPCSPH